ncbi:hybrid sensor histidine kinase/response regulator [Sphingomonas sp. ABOLD]|uniref:histidine kinase n=1 Tax=Sphingomonas trueperi TaxID=53317 RepID=A0A7X5Y3B2_9SPHN|nr:MULTISPECIES: hybrid sensor histidine kinase/response regulator [Sphingomonas]NJB98646.1 signal transduction histidine kinase [Sphingomonas trueperi]RSV47182.1 hybrid sensor histidine kinase/response regulator [Sphingomonas sp. ABOLD]
MSAPDPVKFLLVDDLDENLLALEALLRRDGLECLKARSGDEALELLLVHDVALALLDVQMPGMDGFELAEFLRGNERTRHVPIIFLTAGSADAQRRFRGYEAGAVDFLQKPIDAGILRSKSNVFFDLYEQRRQIIAQRDELARLTESLRLADRRKNAFLGMVGHELRNPIMAFGAGLHLLKRRAGEDAGEQVRAQMERQVTHMARLIEDLLDVARIDQGKIVLRAERIDLGDALALAVELSRPQIEARGHRLTLDLPEAPVWLHADQARIAQVVSNLLSNAAKYTPEGGAIDLRVRQEAGQVAIEVADTGLGIPPEMQGQVFDLFAQVDRSGEQADGLGIGLALVRQLVRLHGGSIVLKESVVGQGSTFRVLLPRAD